jgi:predicted DNA-binding transcriptional regulator AlpA
MTSPLERSNSGDLRSEFSSETIARTATADYIPGPRIGHVPFHSFTGKITPMPKALGNPVRRGPAPTTLRLTELAEFLGVSEKGLYKIISASDFPAPCMFSEHTRVWLKRDIVNWLRSRQERKARALLPSQELCL